MWFGVLDVANQELLEECCDAEGRVQSPSSTDTAPVWNSPNDFCGVSIILSGLKREKINSFLPLGTEWKTLFFNGKMSQVVPGQGDFGGWAQPPSPGRFWFTCPRKRTLLWKKPTWAGFSTSCASGTLGKEEKTPTNPHQPLQQLQKQAHGCDGDVFNLCFLGPDSLGWWTGAPGEENSSTAGKHQKCFFSEELVRKLFPAPPWLLWDSLVPSPRLRCNYWITGG